VQPPSLGRVKEGAAAGLEAGKHALPLGLPRLHDGIVVLGDVQVEEALRGEASPTRLADVLVAQAVVCFQGRRGGEGVAAAPNHTGHSSFFLHSAHFGSRLASLLLQRPLAHCLPRAHCHPMDSCHWLVDWWTVLSRATARLLPPTITNKATQPPARPVTTQHSCWTPSSHRANGSHLPCWIVRLLGPPPC